ncbi:MAG: BglII/BstYI family type II restriction endonuclease [Dehalococcoidia bacterium]
MSWEKYIPADLQKLYVIYDFRHAASILYNEFPDEFNEICNALRKFRFTKTDVTTAGGNESQIPKKFSALLRPSWKEMQLKAKLVVDDEQVVSQDTHKIDYTKGRIALDVEWNSKDQTYDRDLYAFRTFFEYNKISVGVIITRSDELDPWFATLGKKEKSGGKVSEIKAKYGASTTHIGKLLPRLQAGRHGGCPILVFGITPRLLDER